MEKGGDILDKVTILGIEIDRITMQQAVCRFMEFLEGGKTHVIYTPNSEIAEAAQKDGELKDILNQADLLLPDGIGIVYASKILKQPLPERVAGFDFIQNICDALKDKKYSIFLLGAKPGVAETAAENLTKRYPGLTIAGVQDGYFQTDGPVIEQINQSGADVVFVCLGAPKQEKWIHKNKHQLKASVLIGAGGTLDGLAGVVKRAPEFYQKHGLEWFYRLIKEPSRFFRMLSLPRFGLKVILSRFRKNL